MGEAKRRKDLGLPPRKINEIKQRKDLGFPPKQINKEDIRNKVRNTLSKYPFIPLIFYGVALITLLVGVYRIFGYVK